MNTVKYKGQRIDFDAAVNLMDDDIRESLSNNLLDIKNLTNQNFFDAYVHHHFEEFGEEFLISEETGLLCW